MADHARRADLCGPDAGFEAAALRETIAAEINDLLWSRSRRTRTSGGPWRSWRWSCSAHRRPASPRWAGCSGDGERSRCGPRRAIHGLRAVAGTRCAAAEEVPVARRTPGGAEQTAEEIVGRPLLGPPIVRSLSPGRKAAGEHGGPNRRGSHTNDEARPRPTWPAELTFPTGVNATGSTEARWRTGGGTPRPGAPPCRGGCGGSDEVDGTGRRSDCCVCGPSVERCAHAAVLGLGEVSRRRKRRKRGAAGARRGPRPTGTITSRSTTRGYTRRRMGVGATAV